MQTGAKRSRADDRDMYLVRDWQRMVLKFMVIKSNAISQKLMQYLDMPRPQGLLPGQATVGPRCQ